ncbi:MAG: FAD-binding dehydrogenase [Aquabacterium sp.]|nr:FAD-binding dehydrogenase [Aquabacterium sp.]
MHIPPCVNAVSSQSTSNSIIVIGAGLAGLTATLGLLDQGHKVHLLDRCNEDQLGGLGLHAFGGMALVNTPLQRLNGIHDSADIALADWLGFADFGPEDTWPRRWAEHYVNRCVPEVYEWLRDKGIHFIPAVQWVERGWMTRGNTLPRYHVLWGTSRHMMQVLLKTLQAHPQRKRLTILTRHKVNALTRRGSRITGCGGVNEDTQAPFELQADAVIVATGGITGDLNRVRQNWPSAWGRAPTELLNGSHPTADGLLHDAVHTLGGKVTHLDQMWNYAAGVRHPRPHFAGHGLSLIPAKSALWLDPDGQRIGPVPFVTGFDTHEMVAQIARAQWPWTWQILNRRIATRELAASGAEHNQHIRDRRPLALLWQMLRGNHALVDELLTQCPDVVEGRDLAELAQRMNAINGDQRIQASTLREQIQPYDDQIARGPRLHNDDQLRRIEHMRHWPGDRIRTCRYHAILDPHAGPLMAIRCQLLTRKSMGGIQTDLHSRVLDSAGEPMIGLYAVGEAAGFGGGGANGRKSLEGTFLSGCILTAHAAARHLTGQNQDTP